MNELIGSDEVQIDFLLVELCWIYTTHVKRTRRLWARRCVFALR